MLVADKGVEGCLCLLEEYAVMLYPCVLKAVLYMRYAYAFPLQLYAHECVLVAVLAEVVAERDGCEHLTACHEVECREVSVWVSLPVCEASLRLCRLLVSVSERCVWPWLVFRVCQSAYYYSCLFCGMAGSGEITVYEVAVCDTRVTVCDDTPLSSRLADEPVAYPCPADVLSEEDIPAAWHIVYTLVRGDGCMVGASIVHDDNLMACPRSLTLSLEVSDEAEAWGVVCRYEY